MERKALSDRWKDVEALTFFNRCGLIPRSLLRSGGWWLCQSPSFPHVFSGNPGEFRTGAPIKTFGGDNLGESHPRVS